MFISELNAEQLTIVHKTNLLYKGIKDDGESGDCIFVVGSSKAVQYRLPKAVELYHEGRARKILFSGGVQWPEYNFPEAIELKNEAIKLGVRPEDILIEDLSLHTKENVLASLFVLDRAFDLHKIKRLLVVTASYHMRRLHLNLLTYMPFWIEYTLCPVDDRTTKEENWFLSDAGRKRVNEETTKIINYVKEGALIDIDVLI